MKVKCYIFLMLCFSLSAYASGHFDGDTIGNFAYKTVFVPALAQSLDRFLHPLENILSVQQKTGKNMTKAIMHIYKEKGVQGFYNGFKLPFFLFSPSRILMNSFYFNMKDVFLDQSMSFMHSLLFCSIGAGIIDATISTPAENYRTRKILNIKNPLTFSDFYTGYKAMLCRSVIGVTMILGGTDLLLSSNILPTYMHNPFVCSFIMGVLSQFFTSPFDVIKNELIASADRSVTFKDTFKKILFEKTYYRGLPTKMIRMGFGSAVVISTIYALKDRTFP